MILKINLWYIFEKCFNQSINYPLISRPPQFEPWLHFWTKCFKIRFKTTELFSSQTDYGTIKYRELVQNSLWRMITEQYCLILVASGIRVSQYHIFICYGLEVRIMFQNMEQKSNCGKIPHKFTQLIKSILSHHITGFHSFNIKMNPKY